MQNLWENKKLIEVLEQGGVAVMPTDTLYGIVGQALNKKVVEKIYGIRKRDLAKPCIILIGDMNELEKFPIILLEAQKNIIKNYWHKDGKAVSIILDCDNSQLEYLHRGTKTLAFRVPQNVNLQNLLKEVGPLVAPSANLQGLAVALNISEAKKYFGALVDLYVDGGQIIGQPSKVIRLFNDGTVSIIRA